MIRFSLILMVLFSFSSTLYADTVVHINEEGKTVSLTGTVTLEDNKSVNIAVDGKIIELKSLAVVSVSRSSFPVFLINAHITALQGAINQRKRSSAVSALEKIKFDLTVL